MKRNKKIGIPIFILTGILCSFILLYLKDSQPLGHKLKVIYIPKVIDQSNDFWTTLISGAEMAAQEYDIQLEVQAPVSEMDYETQNQLIEAAVREQPDVIAVSPIAYEESSQSVIAAQEAGIPVVFIDSTVAGTKGSCIVATDNYAAGKKMGTFINTMVDENSKISIVAHVKDSSTALEREAGLRDSLKEHASKITGTVFCDSDFEKSYRLTVELLRENPDINIIAGLNEYSAVGAGNAIRDLGLSGQVNVIGFDNSIAAIKFLEEGVFQGLIIQNSFNMGYLGIEAAYKAAYGLSQESFIDSGSELITRDNMYTDESQKLLFSFLTN